MRYLIVFFVLSFMFVGSVSAEVIARESTIEEKLQATFWDAPVMIEIARCESGKRMYDKNGKVLKGKVNPKDRGIFQINVFYHLATATSLGYDIHTVSGNIQMARHLYNKNGVRDWSASKSCWGKTS